MPSLVRPFALLALVAASACSSYDFAAARLPDGSYDMAKLIADLDASGKDQLSSGLWIPLVWLDLETFGRSDPLLPDGYTLSRMASIGPLFLGGHRETHVVDVHGLDVERHWTTWAAWGMAYFDDSEAVSTTYGKRLSGQTRYLLLLGGTSLFYAPIDDA